MLNKYGANKKLSDNLSSLLIDCSSLLNIVKQNKTKQHNVSINFAHLINRSKFL